MWLALQRRVVRRTVAGVLAICMALAVLVPISGTALASADPILVCQQSTDGTKATYTFPTDCNTTVTALLPTGYDTLIVDITARCTSTSAYSLGLKVNFNGDFGSNYDSYLQPEGGAQVINNNFTYLDLTDLTCSKSPTPDDADTALELIIPFASSTVFHKQVIGHSSTTAYSATLTGTTNWDGLGSGTWHRPAIGAVNRIDFRTSAGNFDTGLTFDIYAQ